MTQATDILQQIFNDKDILEIACGTGYWTERMAKTAKTILATDINKTVIEVAKSKTYSPAEVTFQTVDIFNLPDDIKYKSIFGGFIWSHIKVECLNSFIDKVCNLIVKGGTAVFIDNNFVKGSNLPITDVDTNGNTFQTRRLENGSIHKVLKNFPTKKFLRQILKDKATNINIINLEYYWILTFKNV
ncbi:MAG: class I SAM-dependent methyltransferase [Segetibacter sp.]